MRHMCRSKPNHVIGELFSIANYRKESKMLRKRIPAILIAFFAIFTISIASANAASYTKVLPEGLSGSAKKAKSRIAVLTANDAAVQDRLAHDYGLTAEEVAQSKVTSIKRSSTVLGKNEDNSARNVLTGDIVATSYMHGQEVTTWTVKLKVSESKTFTVKWKSDCSNPLLRKGGKKPPMRRVSKSKTFTFPFRKSKTTKETIVCPSGQKIEIKVVSKVTGRVKIRTITSGVKIVSQRLKAQISADVKNTITVKCAPFAPPPAPAPPAQTNKCSAGQVFDSNGNCVNQSIAQKCDAGTIWNGTQCMAITNNCGVVVIGDGNNVNSDNCGNKEEVNICTANGGSWHNNVCTYPPAPAPKCPDGRPIPPNGDCDRPPSITVIWPPHIYVRGSQQVYLAASDPDNDVLNVTVGVTSSTSGARLSSVVPSDNYDKGPCPSGKTCYRATLWAGTSPEFVHLWAKVSAGGKSDTTEGVVEVVKDEF